MTIYYIDPHTTTNGTGTWASPYSINSSVRATLVSGDEYRIKGIPLTSLLTATVYTATYTSYYQLTITAGGGLGADFAANDIIYLPDAGTFIKISSVVTNVLTIVSSAMMPWYNTSTGQTTITVRRVNLASYPAGTTTTNFYLANNSSTPNITISDCWTDAVTRVTDGTVKTLINTSTTSINSICYIDGSSGTNPPTSTNRTYSLENTHIFGGNTASGYVSAQITASYVTATIGQIVGNAYSSSYSGINIGTSTSPCYSNTVTVTHATNIQLLGSPSYINTYNLTCTNMAMPQIDAAITGTILAINNVRNFTVTLNTLVCNSVYTRAAFLNYYGYLTDAAITINGPVELYSNTALVCISGGGFGTYTITFGASFTYKYSRRASTQSTIANLFNASSAWIGTPETFYFVPTLTAPSGWTVTGPPYTMGGSSLPNTTMQTTYLQPAQVTLSLPTTVTATAQPYALAKMTNTLVIHRDGSAPYEVLGLNATLQLNTGAAYTQAPFVTTDATVYRTAGPSLKAYLQTYSTTIWSLSYSANPKKSIKIPVTAGVSVTVAGYIRTDQTTYANGDVVMKVVFNETVLGSQNMTTACIGAWEGFSFTFTPTYTGEALLLWEMKYSMAGSYWLDDLTIT